MQARALAVLFLAMVAVPSGVMAVLMLAHLEGHWLLAEGLVGVLLAGLGWGLLRRLSRRERLACGAVVVGAIALAGVVTALLCDTTTDGRWYHTDAILGLLRGVNPIYGQIAAEQPVWANHYPKAMWYFAALVIHGTGIFQLGKIYHLLLVFAVAAYAVDVLGRLGVRGWARVVLTVCAAAGPVEMAQMVSFYVDGALGSLLTLAMLAGIVLLVQPRRLDAAIFTTAGALAVGTKFTAIPYLGVIVLVVVGAQLLPRRWVQFVVAGGLKKTLACAVVALGVGIFIYGFNPYVTNVAEGHHPLYPILGAERVDIISPTAPMSFQGPGYNRLTKLGVSLLGRTLARSRCDVALPNGHRGAVADCVEEMKIPFAVRRDELLSAGQPNTHIAGWGVFFSGVTLGALVLLVLVVGGGWAKSWTELFPGLVGVAMAVATTLANPECWWARYVPQLALLPVFLLLAVVLGAGAGWVRRFGLGLAVVLVANSLITAGSAMGASYVKTRHLEQVFAQLARERGAGEYWAYRNPGHKGEGWAYENPESKVHYEQFSGREGIVICGEVNAPVAGLPPGGFAVGLNMRGATEVTLYRGSCAAGQPF